jgi:hypothetical protein
VGIIAFWKAQIRRFIQSGESAISPKTCSDIQASKDNSLKTALLVLMLFLAGCKTELDQQETILPMTGTNPVPGIIGLKQTTWLGPTKGGDGYQSCGGVEFKNGSWAAYAHTVRLTFPSRSEAVHWLTTTWCKA